MLKWVTFGIAAVAGAWLRVVLNDAVMRGVEAKDFPLGTLIINLAGCFIAGFALAILERRGSAPETLTLALFGGFLGAFTTFSAFALQSLQLANKGAFIMATAYILLSNAGGLAGVFFGYVIASLIFR